jgi:ribosomal protein S18 acetylase RimI-like enzyme
MIEIGGGLEIQISPMIRENTNEVAIVHTRSFKGFFLTFLGPRFLNELYGSIVQDPHGIAYVAERDNTILGFVAGSACPTDLYRNMIRQRFLPFAWASLFGVIQKPSILPRLLRAFRKTSEENPVENSGMLMSIGVLPEAQGQGIGKKLVHAFLSDARQRGLDYVLLNTDADENFSTNEFYRKLGFLIHTTFTTPEGRRMHEYIISLSSSVPTRFTVRTRSEFVEGRDFMI